MKKKVIYGFSGDPITKGHIDVIERALAVFGELIVGIGMNPAKKYFLSLEERRILAEESLKSYENIKVISFRGLLVDYAYENGINTVIRGIRNNEDLNYEVMLYQIGKSQQLNIDTIFFPSSQELSHISSGASKALQLEQGLIHEYVPLCVKQKLEQKLSKQYIISITGLIGSGKSFISNKLLEIASYSNIEAYVVDIDKIGHQILGSLEQPLYVELRNKIANTFGKELLLSDGFIDRKQLGKILFSNKQLLDEFNLLIYKPLLLRLRREIYGKKGLIILDSALIAESEMGYLSNNNIVLVDVDKESQNKRLNNRGYTTEQIENRLNSQYTFELKEKMISDSIARDNHGIIWKINNSSDENDEQIKELFSNIIQTLNIKTEDL
ncbi:pantetheine-phosphate adenylyltransferase [Tenacibaculum sp. M341]|uniref:pantetheine-phosphate adenylyltransferase n=1 Tax=Tenacibaculum sp. M341 TaxID=2530339 RepID=UPI00104629A1|nr:pantetheine-phosphate adenylyltransferase [Tenacibaculum sp. M341]TCI90550.1 pantetheine-phosphate adenylyltransferase [Tenacibaculum sp. M341]